MFSKGLKTRAHLSLLIANIIFGVNFSVAKAVMPDQIKPMTLTVLRSISGVLLFWATSLFLPKEKVATKDILFLAFCSLFGVVINQTLFLFGLNYTSPINSSIIISTNPIFAFILAMLILKENITFLKGIGLSIGLTGVLILILENGTPDINSKTFVGDIATLLNTISWAFYTVIIKRMLEKYHPVTVMKWTFLFGMLVMLMIGFPALKSTDWQIITLQGWLEIGFVLIFATYLGYIFISLGLRQLSPTVVSVYTYIGPIVAAFVAVIVGQDVLNTKIIIAAILIFAGVFVVSWSKKPLKN
jgi:drug/metabolite transporter (DMT)-like permease